jgi:transposase-like protein
MPLAPCGIDRVNHAAAYARDMHISSRSLLPGVRPVLPSITRRSRTELVVHDRASSLRVFVKVGTIMEDNLIPLSKWLAAFWLLANAKNGVSSYEIHRSIGITQKSAWFVLQRIRLAMQTGTFLKFKGQVEADETFIGGKARFMHKDRKERRGKGTGGVGKEVVLGFLERRGKDGHSVVRPIHVNGQSRATIEPKVREHVEKGSELFTDSLSSYSELTPEFRHQFVDHAERYVDGQVHTNGLENFWPLLKRSIKGTYVSVEPFHLFRYLDEQAFRFNRRGLNDGERFNRVCEGMTGKRLTYLTE